MTISQKTDGKPPVALTIAGLDPSGGAGVVADIHTFDLLGVYGMAVATSITYQNTSGLSGRFDLPYDVVRDQLGALFSDRLPDAIKTGVLGTADTVLEIALRLERGYAGPLVVDPIIASSDGAPLLEDDGLRALIEHLVPAATLITPNVKELSLLCGFDVFDVEDIKTAVLFLKRLGARAVVVTGVRSEHGETMNAHDILFDGSVFKIFTSPWVEGLDVHGTGCVFSAAITAGLANGANLVSAVKNARVVVRNATTRALAVGDGRSSANPRGLKRGRRKRAQG